MGKIIAYYLALCLLLFTDVHAQQLYALDFGNGKTASGYQQVNALTKYTNEKGYGFDLNSQPVAIDRKGTNPLTSDFCTSNAPFFFSIALPEGNYRVSITLGDDWQPAETTIKAESRQLISKNIITKAGEHITIHFAVNVRDSMIESGRPIKLKHDEHDKLDWDNKLTLEFSGARPCVDAITIERDENIPTIFLAGNSTVTDQGVEPWASWGQMFPYFIKPGAAAIANYAVSGSTLKAFIAERRLEKISRLMKPGDYLFVEFAHNDQKPGPNHVDPYTSYNEYLRIFIDSARAHGAIPVLVTSTCRRFFDSTGHIMPTLGDYPDAMQYEARKDHVLLIDLNDMTRTLYETLGQENSKQLFVQYPAGTFPDQEKALTDNTHFNDFGAFELAKCVAWYIIQHQLPLKKYIDEEKIGNFSPTHPDDFKKWDLPLTPLFTTAKPAGS
ncbi:rhamnogalacturonan acetylesterase [Thermoflavifilum thermophilum]|uniref:Lysophospholipase L1 n=1 Tax=Thermoflavifilum thermophilum TaxID=1393122 RepID=A0A1I7NIX1_9BACT|nr:rhamnogalacturonan acetylesterase [Thermoflavifilum thermophilum]SFV34605.1 Lysophospholipase L1 [Thermoflavifilum thermophilum]